MCAMISARCESDSRKVDTPPVNQPGGPGGETARPRAASPGDHVDHPLDAELVATLAVEVAPHLLLERHRHLAAVGELRPRLLEALARVAAEADRDAVAGVERHAG